MAFVATETEMRALAASLGADWRPGDVVLLEGPLGAGKTTFVRGYLESLGHEGPVRSPTFNLVQEFLTRPPVMHADLYRVSTHHGIGLEEYLDTHVCLIEWPDRAEGLAHSSVCWHVRISFEGEGRTVEIVPPAA